ncbi:hypothetical protein RFI_32582, partial [Reticulomyxa filosa]
KHQLSLFYYKKLFQVEIDLLKINMTEDCQFIERLNKMLNTCNLPTEFSSLIKVKENWIKFCRQPKLYRNPKDQNKFGIFEKSSECTSKSIVGSDEHISLDDLISVIQSNDCSMNVIENLRAWVKGIENEYNCFFYISFTNRYVTTQNILFNYANYLSLGKNNNFHLYICQHNL